MFMVKTGQRATGYRVLVCWRASWVGVFAFLWRASEQATLRPVSLLRLSLPRLLDSRFAGNYLWTWKCHPLNSRSCGVLLHNVLSIFALRSCLRHLRFMHIVIRYMHMPLSLCTNICAYINIHIRAYGRFPRPASTKTQKWAHFACESKNTPYQSKKHRGYMKQTYPTLCSESILCFLGPLRDMLRG